MVGREVEKEGQGEVVGWGGEGRQFVRHEQCTRLAQGEKEAQGKGSTEETACLGEREE